VPRPGGTTTAPVTGGGGAAPETGDPARAGGLLPAEVTAATPGNLAPPFPFRSLVLAYLFLVPMNFVVQVYGGSVIAERIGRRAEPVLASPARAWEIVLGKALPHLALLMGVSVAVAVAIGAGWLSVVAVLPLALAFLALEFLAALVARSFRELTFLTVFISVALTVYAFLPAVFAQLGAVALVSPISLVVLDLRGEPVSLGEALYATLPLAGLALAMFALGAALYREEDLFHQKPIGAKLLDALAGQVRSWKSGFKVAVLLIPCVFVAELLLVVALVAVSGPLALAGGLVAVAVIEEACKGLPSYAAVQRGALPRGEVVRFGALAGVGFFVAEKGFLLAALVGLTDLPAGTAVFGGAGAGLAPGLGTAPLLALLVAPLGLHVATATLSAWGARGGKALFAASFATAVVVHASYNAVVLTATLEALR
jgi:ABC-type Na+ efflux pump permease subunit